MAFVLAWLEQSWDMLLEAAPWLFGGFVLSGLVYMLLPTDKVVSHLGKSGLGAVLKASLVGIPLPLCSCSVIPVASSIRQRGASRGATASFLVSTPQTGVDSIAISYALLGPFLAVARPIAAFITAVCAGTLVSAAEQRGEVGEAPEASGGHACGCCCGSKQQPAQVSSAKRIVAALRYGLVDMFGNLSHWLLMGFLLGGLVSALVPRGFLEGFAGDGVGAMLLIALVGLPLYVCSTSATPIAAALLAKGLSPGAALVFLLAGPATNIATMVVVARDLGRRSLVIYLATIAIVSILLGLAVNAFWRPAWGVPAEAVHVHAHAHTSPVSWVFAVILLGLMLNGLRMRWRRTSAKAPQEAVA